MTPENELREEAKRFMGGRAILRIEELLALHPPEFGYKMAKARLIGMISAHEYTEAEYLKHSLDKRERKATKALTATLMESVEKFKTRNNSKRKTRVSGR